MFLSDIKQVAATIYSIYTVASKIGPDVAWAFRDPIQNFCKTETLPNLFSVYSDQEIVILEKLKLIARIPSCSSFFNIPYCQSLKNSIILIFKLMLITFLKTFLTMKTEKVTKLVRVKALWDKSL